MCFNLSLAILRNVVVGYMVDIYLFKKLPNYFPEQIYIPIESI